MRAPDSGVNVFSLSETTTYCKNFKFFKNGVREAENDCNIFHDCEKNMPELKLSQIVLQGNSSILFIKIKIMSFQKIQ